MKGVVHASARHWDLPSQCYWLLLNIRNMNIYGLRGGDMNGF